MRNALTCLATALALGACGRTEPAAPAEPPAAPAAPSAATPAAPPSLPAEPAPAADPDGPLPGASLPPADAKYRYVGLWAADVKACQDPPWRFEDRRLATKGEVTCAFGDPQRTASGYVIPSTCIAQAPPEKHTLKLTFAESAKAMLVEGGPFSGPVALVWCGPLP